MTGVGYTFGRTCHYCPAPATTKDHIVSRHTIRRLKRTRPDIPQSVWSKFHAINIVPACQKCNTRKSNRFPTCECEKCRTATADFHRIALTRDYSRT